MADDKQQSKGNGGLVGVLHSLASGGDRTVQLGTLALVAISGILSFFQGEKLSQQSVEDRDKAVRQIHLLYERVDDFERRQLQALSNQNQIMDSNTEQIKNQGEILAILREGQKQFLQRQQRLFKQEP